MFLMFLQLFRSMVITTTSQKWRQVKTATPKRWQIWLYSKRRLTQTTPTVIVKPIYNRP